MHLKYVQFIIIGIAAPTAYYQNNNETAQGGFKRTHAPLLPVAELLRPDHRETLV